jgi:hypothetical protein
MTSEGYKATYDLQVNINYDDNKINVWTDDSASEKQCKKEKFQGQYEDIGKRHYANLCAYKSRDQAFDTFRNSMNSNFYMGNSKFILSNSIIRFAIRTRNDTLRTPARKARIFGAENNNPFVGVITKESVMNFTF